MANLKDINYGIGKYLEASDATSLPDIGTNRKNLDLLNFKVATNNAYSLYNFKDGMIDAYQDQTGVDTAASSAESYDSTNKLFETELGATVAFTSAGTTSWTPPAGVTNLTHVLVVGGGGGGGNQVGGGGGAGGLSYQANRTVSNTAYTVTVGAGGATGPNASTRGVNGGNSVFDTITSNGGGGGGSYNNSQPLGGTGGSGGGSSRGAYPHPSIGGGPSNQGDTGGATGFGNAGGDRDTGTSSKSSGGGGGAGAVGVAGSGGGSNIGGAGGAGKDYSAQFASYGASGWFAGGGGGARGSGSGTNGAGGQGGGQVGGPAATGSGTANTGGGGGGGSDQGGGGAGGSGVVLLTYEQSGMTIVSNTQTAQADPAEGRLMLYEEDVDSITPGTDIKGYVSRDGGTTWSSAVGLTQDIIYENIAFNQGGNDAYTVLLLHCDGADSGTVWTDSSSSAHVITKSGGSDPQTKTAIKKFGTASGKWNNASYLEAPDSADWHFGSGDYTVDFWLYHTSHCSNDHFDFIISQPNAGGNQSYIGTRRANSGDYYMMSNFSGQSCQSDADISITLDEWNHWAIVKNDDKVYFYKDGVRQGPLGGVTATVAWPDYNVPLRIGYQQDVEYYNGYADEIRISKGIARFTENFTPATRLSEAYNAGTYTLASTRRLLSGSVDISGQPAGSNMKYKVETLNSKNLKLHGASLLWA